MTVNETTNRPLKRMRNRVTADHYYDYDFYTFSTSASGDPFRIAVQSFLSKHAAVTCTPSSLFPSLLTWQMVFRVGDLPDAVVVLDIVEEDVTRSTSRSVYCDQCRVVGWSGHPVCRNRYHFIIRADAHSHCKINNGAIDDYQNYYKTCPRCGIFSPNSRCECSKTMTTDDVEEWICSQLEDNTHLLHGVVHLNGYGHLLTVNGREGGSELISGSDIMNFWDRLCRALSVRKVTVMDMSKKYGMEYRLLHAVVKGYPWYGNWGYEFTSGSYAITLDEYQRAVEILSNIPLSSLYKRRAHQNRVHDIISFYQYLSESELVTTKDLFSFMLRLMHQTCQPLTNKKSKRRKIESDTINILCAWTRNDVENVQQGMIKVLAAGGANWVSRRTLKGAMSKAASPQLLDYGLKHLDGKLAPIGMVVQTRRNPNSSDVEFRLEALDFNSGVGNGTSYPSEAHIASHLKYLFDQLLHPETMNPILHGLGEWAIDSATKLLDSKQFMKDYKLDSPSIDNPLAIRIWCHMELSDQDNDDSLPPSELIVLPLNATVADLKGEATNAFQDVYAMYKKIKIKKLLEYGSVEDSITLKLLVGSFGHIKVQGWCPTNHGLIRFRMERGTEEWTVDCICGATDDDGERMLACDSCEIWQHTRCAGINSSDDIPKKFVCTTCATESKEEVNQVSTKSNCSLPKSNEADQVSNNSNSSIPESKEEANKVSTNISDSNESSRIAKSSSTCREQVANSGRVDTRLTVAYQVG